MLVHTPPLVVVEAQQPETLVTVEATDPEAVQAGLVLQQILQQVITDQQVEKVAHY